MARISSGLPDASCIFNDVTVGNNVVPGETGTLYQAGAGFDMATGFGSPNVGNLVSQWNSVTFNPTTTTLALTPTTNIAHGAPVAVNISVAPATGPGTPTGDVSLLAANALTSCFGKSAATDGGTLANGSSAFSTQVLPGGGPYCVWAHYAADSTWAPSDSNTTMVTVTPEPSTTAVSVLTGDQNGNPVPFTGGPFGSFVYLRADVAGQSGQGVPTGKRHEFRRQLRTDTWRRKLRFEQRKGNTATPMEWSRLIRARTRSPLCMPAIPASTRATQRSRRPLRSPLDFSPPFHLPSPPW